MPSHCQHRLSLLGGWSASQQAIHISGKPGTCEGFDLEFDVTHAVPQKNIAKAGNVRMPMTTRTLSNLACRVIVFSANMPRGRHSAGLKHACLSLNEETCPAHNVANAWAHGNIRMKEYMFRAEKPETLTMIAS